MTYFLVNVPEIFSIYFCVSRSPDTWNLNIIEEKSGQPPPETRIDRDSLLVG
jgi:hypothetical protein